MSLPVRGSDGRRATIGQVAERARVSTATVSNFLNGRFSSMRGETLARVRTAIEELGYVPSGAAKALRTNRSHILSLVIPSISGPFFAQFARGAEDEALGRGYMLFVCSSDHLVERERAYAEAMFEKQVDGAIFTSSASGADHVLHLHRRGIRIVLFETERAGLDVGSVAFDNVRAVGMAVQYLVSLGHRRIAHVTGPLTRRTRLARAEGYRAGLAAGGLAFDPALLLEAPLERKARTGTYELATGEELARRLVGLPDPPTAVVAVNDMAALGVIRGLFNVGVQVPGDISVMGIDDLPIAELVRPSLTTIVHPAYEMGAAAARLLLERLDAGGDGRERPNRVVRFEPRLVVRESTAPPPVRQP